MTISSKPYPTQITLCEGKYTIIYDYNTGISECLRYGEKWRSLCGDKMVMAMFDRIVELEEILQRAVAIAHCDGLKELNQFDALCEIRKLTLEYFDSNNLMKN